MTSINKIIVTTKTRTDRRQAWAMRALMAAGALFIVASLLIA